MENKNPIKRTDAYVSQGVQWTKVDFNKYVLNCDPPLFYRFCFRGSLVMQNTFDKQTNDNYKQSNFELCHGHGKLHSALVPFPDGRGEVRASDLMYLWKNQVNQFSQNLDSTVLHLTEFWSRPCMKSWSLNIQTKLMSSAFLRWCLLSLLPSYYKEKKKIQILFHPQRALNPI